MHEGVEWRTFGFILCTILWPVNLDNRALSTENVKSLGYLTDEHDSRSDLDNFSVFLMHHSVNPWVNSVPYWVSFTNHLSPFYPGATVGKITRIAHTIFIFSLLNGRLGP